MVLTKNQGEKGKNLPKTQGREGGDTQHLIVIAIPQILSQIQILNRIHQFLILVPLVMGNTRRGGEISTSMGRRGKLDESSGREASTVELKNQDTSLGGLIIAFPLFLIVALLQYVLIELLSFFQEL